MKPSASLSLDLDGTWAYLKAHGNPEWESMPTDFHTSVPRVLEFLERNNQRITFMVVGQDLEREENHEPIRRIAAAGHEFGNHSYGHHIWLATQSEDQIAEEILKAERLIEQVSGRRTTGFRGPGYACSARVLNVLQRNGYVYDSSLLPSILGPLARLYYMWGVRMPREERQRRKDLFGHLRDGLWPLNPFQWAAPGGSLFEVPITTIPLLRVPFHLSYLLYLSRYSWHTASVYLRLGIFLCRVRGIKPTYLLHPLDFLSVQDVPSLAFFPGMDIPVERKLAMAQKVLDQLQRHFDVAPLSQHVDRIREASSTMVINSALVGRAV